MSAVCVVHVKCITCSVCNTVQFVFCVVQYCTVYSASSAVQCSAQRDGRGADKFGLQPVSSEMTRDLIEPPLS